MKVPYFKAEVVKRSEKRVESYNLFFPWACWDVRSWLLTKADLVAGTAQDATSFLLLTFIAVKPTYSQGRGSLGNVFWLGGKKTHLTHPIPILLSPIHMSAPCPFIGLNIHPMEEGR